MAPRRAAQAEALAGRQLDRLTDMKTAADRGGRIQRSLNQAILQPMLAVRSTTLALACLILVGCNGDKAPASAPPSATVDVRPGVRPGLDASAVLKHKIECRALGVQAEKEQFPNGMNTAKNLNQGLMYFGAEFGYSEQLNTCIMLSGSQLTDFRTKSVTSFQATLTDLLANKMLGTYFLLGGQPAPVSMGREAFVAKVRELLGDPVPLWLTAGPIR